jgi:hypothetical protein
MQRDRLLLAEIVGSIERILELTLVGRRPTSTAIAIGATRCCGTS